MFLNKGFRKGVFVKDIFFWLVLLNFFTFGVFSQNALEQHRNSMIFLIVESTDPHTGAISELEATGFVVCHDGHVLTSNHIIPNGEEETFIKGSIGSRFEPKRKLEVIKQEEGLDLLLLKFKGAPPNNITSVVFGDVSYSQAGDSLYSVGFSFGQELTYKEGVVSNKDGPRGNWLTDMPLNQGDSGSPVFDEVGEVVAVVRGGIAGAEGIKHIVPINYAKGLLDKVTCPLLGNAGSNVGDDLEGAGSCNNNTAVAHIEGDVGHNDGDITIGSVLCDTQ